MNTNTHTSPIEQRPLGKSGIVVPTLGIGIWSWGDTMWWNYGQSHTQEDIIQAYRTSLDAGLSFFDTAEIYGSGASERLLGERYREDGRPIVIASKFAPPLTRFSRAARERSSARSLLQALDQSLKRLGVSCIDLYQIHTPSPVLKVDDLMDVLAEAVQAGKVRAVGVSNYSAAQMRQAHTRLARYGIPLASNQVRYSLLHRYPETNGVLEACRELEVALIAYSPLEQGILTGKYRSADVAMSANTRRMLSLFLRLDVPGDTKGSVPVWRRLFTTPRVLQRQKLEPLFVVLEEIAQAHEKTIAQVALNWLVSKDECIIPIPGAKNARQARENAGALGWRLTREEHERISRGEVATR
ncbi:MAG TPA: aldo/keto reductase [Ktedonosporobacter sp.]|nr:aldo/keto reductase [Ktedonosporobacter sp.]